MKMVVMTHRLRLGSLLTASIALVAPPGADDPHPLTTSARLAASRDPSLSRCVMTTIFIKPGGRRQVGGLQSVAPAGLED